MNAITALMDQPIVLARPTVGINSLAPRLKRARVPVRPPYALGMVAAVAAGGGHTCAVTAQTRLLCFEWNAYGQCDVPEDIPVRLEGVSNGFRLGRPFAGSLRKQPVCAQGKRKTGFSSQPSLMGLLHCSQSAP